MSILPFQLGVQHIVSIARNMQQTEKINYPRYSPSPQQKLFTVSDFNLEKPLLPIAKTNTNLATYVHRKYIFDMSRGRSQLQLDDSDYEEGENENEVEDFYSACASLSRISSFTYLSKSDGFARNVSNSLPISIKGSASSRVSPTSYDSSKVHCMASGEVVVLKHNYNPRLSLAVSRKMSLKSGRCIAEY